MKTIFTVLFLLFPSVGLCWNPAMLNIIGSGAPGGITITADLIETLETSEYDNGACGVAPCSVELSGDPNGDTDNFHDADCVGAGNPVSCCTGSGTGNCLDAGIDMEDALCVALDHTEQLQLFFHAGTTNRYFMLGKFAYNDALENDENILVHRTAGDVGRVQAKANGSFYATSVGGGSGSTGVGAHAVDTDVWVKVKAKGTAGVDAEMYVSFWNGAGWNAYAGGAGGTTTGNITYVRLENNQDNASEDQYWDDICIKITDADPFTADPGTITCQY